MRALTFVVLLAATAPTSAADAPQIGAQDIVQRPTPDPNAPPVIDIALRVIRSGDGRSSIARSAARGAESAYVYAGLGPCLVGAAQTDPGRDNSVAWRASGRIRSVERGIAVADVEWQRLDYRSGGAVAGPRVRMLLTLPLGERVAVDFVDTSGSICRTDGLVFEIGAAPDHGTRLSMSGEGQSVTRSTAVIGFASGRGGGGVGFAGAGRGGAQPDPDDAAAQAERLRKAAEAANAATVVTRAMPPRQYQVDTWLVPAAASAGLAQRLSREIGGTGERFVFPPAPIDEASGGAGVIDISALVVPVGGDQLIVAITRRVTPGDGASPLSAGWITAVPMPKGDGVLSFELPSRGQADAAVQPGQRYAVSVRIGRR